MKQITVIMAAVIAVMLMLTACGKEDSGLGGTFYTVITENPKNLDPQTTQDAASKSVIENIFEGLVTVDGDGVPKCAAAESYSLSADGLTYTFRLREGLQWSSVNGFSAELTADDFVYAFRRIFDPDMLSPYAEEFSVIKNSYRVYSGTMSPADLGVRAADERTVVFELERPENEFLYMLAETPAKPCNEEFFLSTEGRYGLAARFCAGNGAFTLTEWNYDPYWTENYLTLRKNPANSFEGHITCPAAVNYVIADSVQEYERDSGNTSDCELYTAASVPVLRKKKAEEYRCSSVGLTFNPDSARFADDNMRFALAAATSPEIFEGETSEGVHPSSRIFPPALCVLGRSVTGDELYGKNAFPPEKAAEWADRREEYSEISGSRLMSILVPDTFADAPLMYMLTDRWSEMTGIECGVEAVSAADYRKRISSGDYDIALTVISCTRNSPSAFIDCFEPYIFNRAMLLEAKANAAAASGSQEVLTALEYCGYAEDSLISGAYYIPLFCQSSFLVTGENTADIRCDPFSGAIIFRDAKKFSQ